MMLSHLLLQDFFVVDVKLKAHVEEGKWAIEEELKWT
jgi:hypothetical protein